MAHIITFILSLSIVLISSFVFKEEYSFIHHAVLTYLIYLFIKQ